MDEGAAFGFFPQLRPRRRLQDPTASADVPLQVLRGRLAGLLGLPSDIGNLIRSPMPMEMFGDYEYEKPPQLPYTTEYFLKELPLAPTAPVGQLAGQAASFVPLNPAPLVRGAQKLGTMVGEGMAERVATGRPMLPSLLAEPQSAMFAVEPNVPRMNLLDTPPETMTSLLEVKPQAAVSDLGFYSAAEQAALNLQRNKGSGQAFLNDLLKAENVKKDELQWMGVDDFLKEKPNVTKQEVQDFIANNRVDVKEVTLGGAQPYDAQRLSALESEYKALKQHPLDDSAFGEDKYDELIRLMNIRDQSTTSSLYDAAEQAIRSGQRAQQQGNNITAEKYFREAELLNTRAEKLDLEGQGMSNPPKYEKYTLPGGENYREILLTMPPKSVTEQTWQVLKPDGTTTTGFFTSEEAARRDAGYIGGTIRQGEPITMQTGYRSSHFGEPNILAHIRVNDRVDADGKKMLLIEEIQSDWHQAGREKGYNTPEKRAAEQKKLDDLVLERQQLLERQKQLEELASPYTSQGKDAPTNILDEWNSVSNKLNRLQTEQNRLGRTFGDTGVPDAPFKDTWYQLALKRVLKHAADNGYERVGLTTGKQQAQRFDLSKQVDEITVPMVNEDGTRSVRIDPTEGTSIKLMVDKDGIVTGYGAGSTQFSGKKLNDVVGKEMSEKIMQAEKMTKFSGVDLQVGGEGMKKYYDEIYPKFLDKYGKKWNARVGETQIKVGEDVVDQGMMAPGIGLIGETTVKAAPRETIRYIDITPEMKGAVSKGQPLFAATPALPLGAQGLLGEPEKKKELGLLN